MPRTTDPPFPETRPSGEGLSAFPHKWLPLAPGQGVFLKVGLFLYIVLLICPIRYWPLGAGIDQTWRFALNYAYAHGATPGIDVVFTSGPLGFLTFPENIGSNLVFGLAFQFSLWLILSLILADVFFRCDFRLRNLALFTFYLGLAAYLFWFDFLGLENLVLAVALTLLVVYRARGNLNRYVIALLLIGFLPLIKLTAALIAVSALVGFLAARIIERRVGVAQELLLAAIVPVTVALGVCSLTIPSRIALTAFLKGSLDMVTGYSAAMSEPGPEIQFVWAFVATALLALMIALPMTGAKSALFYSFFLAGPSFVAFKHAFVRQDNLHVPQFFCYVALAMALVSLSLDLQGLPVKRVLIITALFLPLWIFNRSDLHQFLDSTGLRAPLMLAQALPPDRLQRRLEQGRQDFPAISRLEPEIVKEIGNVPVASMSYQFANLGAAQLQVRVYPAVQRYSAYTPYLDNLDASWVRENGPPFFVFDGDQIDSRNIWAETPAMWLEVYRLYDAPYLGARNLLFKRRAIPRFNTLKTLSQTAFRFPGKFAVPATPGANFWRLTCTPGFSKPLVDFLLRPPVILMSVHRIGGATEESRVIPSLLSLPVLGNFLPSQRQQFFQLFNSGISSEDRVDSVSLTASGVGLQPAGCQVEWLTPDVRNQ